MMMNKKMKKMNLTAIDKLALSQFSSIEKECIYQVVYATMLVDGERHPREHQLVEEIVEVIGLSVEEREMSKLLDETTVIETIRKMSDLQRAYVAKFIAQMILADGKVTDHERLFFNILLDKLNLPEDTSDLK